MTPVVPRLTPELILLGEDPLAVNSLGSDIHEEILKRWQVFLSKGIPKEEKQVLQLKYPRPANFDTLVAPEINPEVKVLLDEQSLRGDSFLSKLQEQLVAGLSALADPVNSLFSRPTAESNVYLEKLLDSARLFINVHHSLSLHRRYLLLPKLNSTTRKVVENTPIHKSLFGEDLTDRVKTVQSVRKASLDLQPPARPKSNIPRQCPSTQSKKLQAPLASTLKVQNQARFSLLEPLHGEKGISQDPGPSFGPSVQASIQGETILDSNVGIKAPFCGRLCRFYDKWTALSTNSLLLSWIRGYKLLATSVFSS